MRRVVILLVFLFLAASMYAEEAKGAVTEAVAQAAWKYIAASVAVGFGCIGGGIAVGRIGAAAMGAMSENPELAGKALPYVGLAEGICLWGFLTSLIILVVG